VVCPFNNLYTVWELVSQLKSSEAKALATHVACLEVAREAALIVGLALDRIFLVGDPDSKGQFRHFSQIQATSTNIDKVVVNPEEDLAFLVFSSGTTGPPKGVMLTHSNIVANTLQSNVMDVGMTDWRKDGTLGFLPMYHIYGELREPFSSALGCARTLTVRYRHRCPHASPTVHRDTDIHDATF
jgi:long-subunit acyl-CoA synthetase (AMP-forming)